MNKTQQPIKEKGNQHKIKQRRAKTTRPPLAGRKQANGLNKKIVSFFVYFFK